MDDSEHSSDEDEVPVVRMMTKILERERTKKPESSPPVPENPADKKPEKKQPEKKPEQKRAHSTIKKRPHINNTRRSRLSQLPPSPPEIDEPSLFGSSFFKPSRPAASPNRHWSMSNAYLDQEQSINDRRLQWLQKQEMFRQGQAPFMTMPTTPKNDDLKSDKIHENNHKNGHKDNNKTGKDDGDKTTKTFKDRFSEISPAIYISAICVAFIMAHQREVIEQYLNQAIMLLFSCFTTVSIGAGAIAGLLLVVRIVASLPAFSGKEKKQQYPKAGKRAEDLDKLKAAFALSNSATSKSMYNDLRGFPDLRPSISHQLPLDPDFNPRQSFFSGRSYSHPVVSSPRPMYGWTRPFEPEVSAYAPPAAPPTGMFVPPASEEYAPPPVQIPITCSYSPYQPSPPAEIHSYREGTPFPEYYAVQEITAKDKRTAFSNPIKVLFKRREREQEPNQKPPGEKPAYVDEFACKPYGPPPRRYRGINV
jgi:hypothetical protein